MLLKEKGLTWLPAAERYGLQTVMRRGFSEPNDSLTPKPG